MWVLGLRLSIPGSKRPALRHVLPLFQALPYVALLIAMLFFIYAVIGMQVSSSHLSPGSPWLGSPKSVARYTLATWNGKTRSLFFS